MTEIESIYMTSIYYCRSGNIREVLFSRGGQIREFMNLGKIIMIVLPISEINKSETHKSAKI